MTILAPKPAVDTAIDLSDVLFATGYDNTPRNRPGERFDQLFEERVDILAATDPDHLAIDSAEARLTFSALDARANQLARHLKSLGFGAGDRFALLFDKSVLSYIATLAVLKINAAYVPLDQSFPSDRIAFICEDAECRAILTIARFRDHLAETGKTVLHLDDQEAAIAAQPTARLTTDEKGEPAEDLAYIIYTSGSTGKPKGVPIDHPQIVNFVRVAAEVYGIRQDDRMYQGLTIAFDFAIEEIWVPLAVGATLVPGPTGARLLGKDLGDFLAEKEVTALCCVPTLLATLEAELPLLRYIMVSGEACPQDLVARWQKPGRIFLNAYGPTEATVTATLTALEAGKPVTIGKPLPTYTIMMLDPEQPKVLARGETGEIGIAGIAVARGYLNREEQTTKAFIDDFVGVPGNDSGRIYRTGDLGRINADGEVEYMGRIDTQVKIRGYRIELTEIESVLMKFPGIAQAVVNKVELAPGAVELAAYYTLKPGAADFDLDAMVDELRQHVPAYMVPSYFEQLDVMPLLPSHKADRKKLPLPAGPRYASRKGAVVAPEGELEIAMAEALSATLKLDEVSVEDNFFDDMGANSLLMAKFCSSLRESGVVAELSMRDTYQYPTIRALADELQSTESGPTIEVELPLPAHRASGFAYWMTGVGQFAFSFAYVALTFWLVLAELEFVFGGTGAWEIYLRSVEATLVVAGALILGPVALKWLLIGRWKVERFPVWSLRYFRFWVVKTLLGISPMRLFAGTPLFNVYLRILGARIGRNSVILNGGTLVASDLLTIGDDTFISRAAAMGGYRTRSGYVEIGPVTVGSRAYVGESTVLGLHTEISDDAQLGNTSALYAGQSVPSGKRYHGSPAIETETNYDRVPHLPISHVRRVLYNLVQIATLVLFSVPVPLAILIAGVPGLADAGELHLAGVNTIQVQWLDLLGITAAGTAGLVVGGHLVVLATTWVVPRLLNPFLKPGRPYPLYGVRYFLLGMMRTFASGGPLPALFGDSSAITGFLQFSGWDLGKVFQTGSNFGSAQKCDVPFLTHIGSGTMVADGLGVINSDYSVSSFTLGEVRIGDNNYLGNAISYPVGGRTGNNVLLGTKVLVPIDGPIRENTGLLGSPPFEIPRVVKRDTEAEHLRVGEAHKKALRGKNRHNLVTAILYLISLWFMTFAGLFFFAAAVAEPVLPVPIQLAIATTATLGFTIVYGYVMEWVSLGFRRLRPMSAPVLSRPFWEHERHWKLCAPGFVGLFNGTPFKGMAWRLLGAKVGKYLFDDGCLFTERSLVEVGDYVTLSSGTTLQSHTLEEGMFKSGIIRIESTATVGNGGFVNYDATMHEGSNLEPDSFLMKGEQVPAGATWGGNPARQIKAGPR